MTYFGLNTFIAITPEIFMLLITSVLVIYGVVYNNKLITNRLIVLNNISILSLFTLTIAVLILLMSPYYSTITYNSVFINDDLTKAIKIIVLLGTITSILISLNYLRFSAIRNFEYMLLILLSTTGILLLISSYNFISMYLSIELQGLSFYVLASMKRNSEYSTEASFKYFILGVFSSGFLLFGFSLLYGITGIINIEQFYKLFIEDVDAVQYIIIYIGLLLILISFLFKIGAAPFHVWLPDVYEGSPISVTAYFAIVPKIALITVVVKSLILVFYNIINQLNFMLIASSIVSMVLASILALYQTKIIRLLAYSAIGHMGYVLIGFCIFSIEAIQSMFLYMIIYIIMTINLYSAVMSLRSHVGNVEIKYIRELINMSKNNPMLAINIAITLFSVAGIPPLAGFYSKLYVFSSAINDNMYLLAVIGVLTSVIAAFYYIYLIRIIYFDKSVIYVYLNSIDRNSAIIISITFLFIVLLFLFSSSILQYTHYLSLLLSI